MLTKNKLPVIISFIFFLLFTTLLSWPVFFGKEVFFTGDNFDLLFPQKFFFREEILQGRVPLWNPYILSGTPYLADINLGTLSPTNLIYLLISPVEKAGSFLLAGELFLIGFVTYLLGRKYNLSQLAAVISGLTFMCSGVILHYCTNLAILNVIVYLPIMVLILEKALEKNSFQLLLFCGILFGLQIFSGHVQITFYSGLFLILLILLKKELSWRSKVKILLTIFSIGMGLSAVQIIPFWELARFTPRVNQGYDWATQGSLTLPDLVKFILPKLAWNFSGWVDFSAKVNLGYLGVIPFILFIISLFRSKGIWKNYRLICFISVILALGKNTFVYKLVYFLIPGISALKNPSQFSALYSFSGALLAGRGFDMLFKSTANSDLPQKNLNKLKAYLIISLLLFCLIVYLLTNISVLPTFLTFLNKFIHFPAKIYGALFKTSVFLINFLILLLLTLLFFVANSLRQTKKYFWSRTFIVVFIMLDLFLSTKAVLLTASVDSITPDNKIEQITREGKIDYKIYSIPPDQFPQEKIFFPSVEEQFAREKRELLLPNQNILKGYVSIDGYVSMAIAGYLNEFTSGVNTVTGLGKLDPLTIDYQKNGVKYILSQNKIPGFAKTPPVIYLVKNSRKRYYLEKGGEVFLIEGNFGKMVFQVINSQKNKFIFLDNYYPGWSVSIDNQEKTIEKFEEIYKSVAVEPGTHILQFEFKPTSLNYGIACSLLTMLLILWLVFKGPKNIYD